MAVGNFFVLFDDIAAVLDDVAAMSKVAAKKTTGVLGDDLALNAQQVAGVRADRELPVVWAVAKGSFKNKLILVPSALLLSAVAPFLITPLLMIGGIYLCFEGVEKIAHSIFHKDEENMHHAELSKAIGDEQVDMVEFEKEKIKGAIKTDFILSAEIIVIALGTVQGAALGSQIAVVSAIAFIMTVGVYGIVAMIVKMDDAGLHLVSNSKEKTAKRVLGNALLEGAPYLMKTLSVVGTIAMFLVGGSILAHGLPFAHDIAHFVETSIKVPFVATLLTMLLDAAIGVVAGALALIGVKIIGKFIAKKHS
jgi:uncharacterized protein